MDKINIRLKRDYHVTSEAVSGRGHSHRVSVLKRDEQAEDGWSEVGHAYASLSNSVHELNVAFATFGAAFEEAPRGEGDAHPRTPGRTDGR